MKHSEATSVTRWRYGNPSHNDKVGFCTAHPQFAKWKVGYHNWTSNFSLRQRRNSEKSCASMGCVFSSLLDLLDYIINPQLLATDSDKQGFEKPQGFQSRVWGVGVRVWIFRPSKTSTPHQGYRSLRSPVVKKIIHYFLENVWFE